MSTVVRKNRLLARVPPDLSDATLSDEEIEWIVLQNITYSKSFTELSERFNIKYRTIQSWVNKYKAKGIINGGPEDCHFWMI
jgi:hypothetical protein